MSRLVQGVVRLLFLPSVVVSIAFCVKASTGEGDGFSGGLVAAMAVALVLLGFGPHEASRSLPLGHAATVAGAGFLLVVGTAVLPAILGAAPLRNYPSTGGREDESEDLAVDRRGEALGDAREFRSAAAPDGSRRARPAAAPSSALEVRSAAAPSSALEVRSAAAPPAPSSAPPSHASRLGAIELNTSLIFDTGIGALVAGGVSLVLARAANVRGRRG